MEHHHRDIRGGTARAAVFGVSDGLVSNVSLVLGVAAGSHYAQGPVRLAGLDWLADKGITVGMLYVDAANEGAVHLYEKLGFTVDHVDRAYVGDVAARSA